MESFIKKERNNKNSMKFPDNVFFKYIKNEKSIQRKKPYLSMKSLVEKRLKEQNFKKSKIKN